MPKCRNQVNRRTSVFLCRCAPCSTCSWTPRSRVPNCACSTRDRRYANAHATISLFHTNWVRKQEVNQQTAESTIWQVDKLNMNSFNYWWIGFRTEPERCHWVSCSSFFSESNKEFKEFSRNENQNHEKRRNQTNHFSTTKKLALRCWEFSMFQRMNRDKVKLTLTFVVSYDQVFF